MASTRTRARPVEQAAPPRRRRPEVLLAVVAVAGVVLRWWGLGSTRPSFDESFTAVYASHPGALFTALRLHDAHPPLDYLVRVPFVALHSVWWLRFPSAVFATATLAIVAWWWHDRGRLGVLVVAFTALSDFQLIHGRQARMYALMILCGAVVGFASDRWLRQGGSRWAVMMGVAVAAGLFTHVSGLLLVVAVLLLPGRRWRGEAGIWRATALAALALWVALWGPAFRQQVARSTSSWIPYTTPGGIARAVSGLVTTSDALAWLVVAIVALGIARWTKADPVLLRLSLCLLVAPVAILATVGLHSHVLLSRTLAFAVMVPLIALAGLVDVCLSKRWLVPGAALMAAVVLLQLTGYATAFRYDDGSVHGMQRLQTAARPGDVVAVHPSWFAPLIEWEWAGQGGLGATRDPSHDLAEVHVPGSPTGRLWLLEPVGYRAAVEGLPQCAAPWQDADERLLCLEVGPPPP